MIRLASEVPLRSDPAFAPAGAEADALGAGDRLRRMRQARSRPWPFRSAAAEVLPTPPFTSEDAGRASVNRPSSFSA